MTRVFLLVIAVAIGACDRKPPVSTAADTTRTAPDTLPAAVEPYRAPTDTSMVTIMDTLPDGTLRFTGRRAFDFDGDSVSEAIHVLATGTHWDSMNVYLTIRSSTDSVMWEDSFTTMRYAGLDPDPEMTRAAIDSVMQHELRFLLSDEAFHSTKEDFDDANISLRDSYAREIYRRRFGGSISDAGSDSVYTRRMESLNIPEAEYVRFEQELMRRPMFRYYIGGESSTGITWSTILGKFIETSVCC